MTVTLVVADSSSTVDLSQAYLVGGYSPRAAPEYEEWLTERGRFKFETSIDTIRTNVQALGRLFVKAKEWHTKRVGEPVYIKIKWQASDDLFRSEIAGGVCMPGDMVLDYPATNNAVMPFELEWTRKNYWEDDTLRTLTTTGYNIQGGTQYIYNNAGMEYKNQGIGTVAGGGSAYSGTATNLPLYAYGGTREIRYNWNSGAHTATVTAGTGATSGGTIAGSGIANGTINYDTGEWAINFTSAPDAGTIMLWIGFHGGNWIDIAGSSITGDMAAPIEFTFGTATQTVVVMGATYGTATNLILWNETETYKAPVISATADAFASQGTVGVYSATADYVANNGTITTPRGWLVNVTVGTVDNAYYVPMLRFRGTPQSTGGTFSIYNTYWTYSVYRSGNSGNVNYEMDYDVDIQNPIEYYDNGTARHTNWMLFPPVTLSNQDIFSSEISAARVGVDAKLIDAAAGSTLYMDYLQLFPTAGGFGIYRLGHFDSTPGTAFIIDGINERAYYKSGNFIRSDITSDYGFVSVMPNQPNRIFVSWTKGDFSQSNVDKTSYTVKYRPRRRSI